MSNEHTNLLTDHTLTNSTEKKIQSGITEMELSNHEPIFEIKWQLGNISNNNEK